MKFDPAVVFYLKHQLKIDEWYALSKQVPDLAHKFFASLEDDLGAAATELAGSPRLYPWLDSDYPKLFLVRPSWQPGESDPRVAIGIEWRRSNVDFRNVYSGIWTDRETKQASRVSNHFRRSLKNYASTHRYEQTHWWTLYQYLKPPDGYWEKLDDFRSQIVDTISGQWTQLYRRVDQILAEASASEGKG